MPDAVKAPNFLIIGGVRSGTTALSEYLAHHPRVFMSTPKELFYFGSEFTALRQARDWSGYLKRFQRATPDLPVRGEATAVYLHSHDAIRQMASVLPSAKLIVLLRDPIELVQSFHRQMLLHGDEDQTSFARAWQLQSARACGHELPRRCRVPMLLQYRELGRLGTQLARVYQHYPRQQVLTLRFDRFQRDPAYSYNQVLSFLELEHDGRKDFPRANAGRVYRNPVVQRLFGQRPRWMQAPVDRIKRALGPRRLSWLQASLTRSPPQHPLPDDLERELRTTFAPELEKLETLTGLDLGHRTEQGAGE